jgi:hypothetical protein
MLKKGNRVAWPPSCSRNGTSLGEEAVLAASGWAGEKEVFLSILLEAFLLSLR